jgi:hypothetical protein
MLFSLVNVIDSDFHFVTESQQITFKMLWSKIVQPRELKLTLFDSLCVQETGCFLREKLEIPVVNYLQQKRCINCMNGRFMNIQLYEK